MNVTSASQREVPARSINRGRPKHLWVAVPIAVGTLALATACGANGGTSTAASSGSMSSPAGTGAALATSTTTLGTVLVDAKGRTVYEFANDKGSTSTCNGGCASEWPPVAAPDPVPTSLAGVSADVGSTTRTDGTGQLTVAGHPVYTFEGDSAPGQTNGNGITLNGGKWSAVSPTGSPVTTASSSASTGY